MSDIEFQMDELVDCILRLQGFFNNQAKVSMWMMIPNPHLGGAAPFDLFTRGRGHKVLAFVKGALEENELESKFKGKT